MISIKILNHNIQVNLSPACFLTKFFFFSHVKQFLLYSNSTHQKPWGVSLIEQFPKVLNFKQKVVQFIFRLFRNIRAGFFLTNIGFQSITGIIY